MWPSLYMENGSKPIKSIDESPLHQVASKLAKGLLGEDMEFDFDMLISKVKQYWITKTTLITLKTHVKAR
jgi:hypothetical protein